jgi:hypothetical protein
MQKWISISDILKFFKIVCEDRDRSVLINLFITKVVEQLTIIAVKVIFSL